jgi:3-isopropylmalate/(R)-2-methylmalate dehydratase large subunit
MVAVDNKTIDYVKDKPLAPTGKEWDKAVKYWNTLRFRRSAPSNLGLNITGFET